MYKIKGTEGVLIIVLLSVSFFFNAQILLNLCFQLIFMMLNFYSRGFIYLHHDFLLFASLILLMAYASFYF